VGTHIIEGEFQSEKLAQDLLWEYTQRHQGVDAEVSRDLEKALINAGFQSPTNQPTK